MKIGDTVKIIDERFKDIATLCGNFEADNIGTIVGIDEQKSNKKQWFYVEVDDMVLTFPENWLEVLPLH